MWYFLGVHNRQHDSFAFNVCNVHALGKYNKTKKVSKDGSSSYKIWIGRIWISRLLSLGLNSSHFSVFINEHLIILEPCNFILYPCALVLVVTLVPVIKKTRIKEIVLNKVYNRLKRISIYSLENCRLQNTWHSYLHMGCKAKTSLTLISNFVWKSALTKRCRR